MHNTKNQVLTTNTTMMLTKGYMILLPTLRKTLYYNKQESNFMIFHIVEGELYILSVCVHVRLVT